MERNTSYFLALADSFDRVLDARAQDAAFGPPDEPGDPDRIIHLARRVASVYEDFMNLAAELRATAVSSEALRRVLDAEASWANQPVERLRAFVERFVREIDTITERIHRGEHADIEVVVKLEVGDDLLEEHSQAMREFVREVRRKA